MLRVTRDDNGLIKQIQTAPGVFSYTYLATPRPEGDFNAGTYGTEFIVNDEETITALKEYLNQEIMANKASLWGGKLPANLHLPLRRGDDENELEAGSFVLKTTSKMQPKLFILDTSTGRAHEVETEEELNDIYAGMIGEVIIKFRAYSYNKINGVKCYINAACKTDDGTPLSARTSYQDAFSLTTEFDTVAETPANVVQTKEVEAEVTIDDLLSSQPTKATTEVASAPAQSFAKPTAKTTAPAKADLTLDDLLK